MKRNLIVCLLTVLTLTGCFRSPDEKERFISESVKNPKYVTKLPDGHEIYLVKIDLNDSDTVGHYHFIYFLKLPDTNTVTVNHTQSVGKTSYNQSIVIIDGKTYNLVPR